MNVKDYAVYKNLPLHRHNVLKRKPMKPQLKPQRIKFYPISAFAGVDRDPADFPDEVYLVITKGRETPIVAYTLRDGQFGTATGAILSRTEFAAIVEFRKPVA